MAASVAPSAPAPGVGGTVSEHLVERILQSRSALEGERKQVTVLFADVQGSMELAEQMDPEGWTAIMQRFFRVLLEGVERFEGFVDKFTGDGIMALFGAPIAHEDHAQRACFAALHLQREAGSSFLLGAKGSTKCSGRASPSVDHAIEAVEHVPPAHRGIVLVPPEVSESRSADHGVHEDQPIDSLRVQRGEELPQPSERPRRGVGPSQGHARDHPVCRRGLKPQTRGETAAARLF